MSRNSALFHLWKRQVFLRSRHEAFTALLSKKAISPGIYLIGCADHIVYIGQTNNLRQRPIESLGNIYHRIPDTSLPWSIAFAPCSYEEMDERESTAIRAYSPKFNTSIPSLGKSQGRMPDMVGTATVFQDQAESGGAFEPQNLKRQMEFAEANPNPPWKTKKRRKKTENRKRQRTDIPTTPIELSSEEVEDLLTAYGVSLNEPLRFKINLCKDGSVITKDGEIIGTWMMDENGHPSFFPTGASEALFFHVWVGMLCNEIKEWHEAKTGEAISE